MRGDYVRSPIIFILKAPRIKWMKVSLSNLEVIYGLQKWSVITVLIHNERFDEDASIESTISVHSRDEWSIIGVGDRPGARLDQSQIVNRSDEVTQETFLRAND